MLLRNGSVKCRKDKCLDRKGIFEVERELKLSRKFIRFVSVSTFDWCYYVNRLCHSTTVVPLTADKSVVIFIDNCFVEQVEEPEMFFSSVFIISYQINRYHC